MHSGLRRIATGSASATRSARTSGRAPICASNGMVSATTSFRRDASTMPSASQRTKKLRELMASQELVRVLECHNGLTALIAEHARGADGSQFDGMWSSSLTGSASKGKPDIETVSTSERLDLVADAFEVSTKPMIYDADTGGHPEVFHFTVRSLERLGVSAAIIEDKTGLKQNSLFGTERKQSLIDIDDFSAKIKAGCAARTDPDFMIIARMESLIAGWGQDEAIKRAKAACDAGADGVMIHSKEKSPDEVLNFLAEYNEIPNKVPIIAVPTTYNVITEAELVKHGVSICIYANHMLRAAYPSMLNVAESILTNKRSKEADEDLLPVKEIITLIDDNTGLK